MILDSSLRTLCYAQNDKNIFNYHSEGAKRPKNLHFERFIAHQRKSDE